MSFSCFYIEKQEKGDNTNSCCRPSPVFLASKLAGSYIYCSSQSVHPRTEIDNHNLSYGCMFEALTKANNFLVSLIG